MAEDTKEQPISEEQRAALGMEAKKGVAGVLERWKEKNITHDPVRKEFLATFSKLKETAKEGSLRRHVFEKMQPVFEAVATAAGLKAKTEKKFLKTIGTIGKAIGIVGIFTPIPGDELFGAVGIGADIASKFVEKKYTIWTKLADKSMEMVGKTGLPHKIDGIVDRILGWKPPAEKVYFAEARPAVIPRR